ncbi:MAG: alpha-galactosidase [Pseudomonadota bacterium]
MNQQQEHHWRIDSAQCTVVLQLQRNMPAVTYWGARLPDALALDEFCAALSRPPVPAALDLPEALTLLPESGTGFAGFPGILAHRNGEHSISQAALERADVDAHSATFVCVEQINEVQMTLTVALDPDSDVLTLRNSVKNLGDNVLHVDWLASGVLPLPHPHSEVCSLTGRWAQEFTQRREPIGASALLRDNRAGRTSHNSFPGLLTGSAGFSADTGYAAAMHLAWSGNHRIWVGRARDGRPYVQLGVLFSNGEQQLQPGDAWQAPELHACVSESGYNPLIHNLHRFVRNQVLPSGLARKPRPVHYNTWEAVYFNHSEASTLALVAEAKQLGAERFVLDDGWFSNRNNDLAGLGNWTVSKRKYPNGLEPIFDAVRAAGMEPGLWIEPEMANEDSDVFREHPEWILGDPQRQQPLGRHQYALNICRDDVFEYLLGHITGVVRRYGLGYLKWDMNRDLAHALVDRRQGEARMAQAIYRLLDAVRAACPDCEIEICSSGGARADYALLRRGERIWTSDNHDPHDRQRIQHGFSLFFPPEVMGAHVGSAISDTTGRYQALSFRVATALLGHFGVEPNKDGISEGDQAVLRRAAHWYIHNRDWLHTGTTWFIDSNEAAVVARAQVSEDRQRAIITNALLDTPHQPILAPLRCRGLDPQARYAVHSLDCLTFERTLVARTTGAALAAAGFQPPVLLPDQAQCFELEVVPS